ncbi:MAG: BspA family leucine-rich repeat surface protein [Methanosphaera sp.]|nr:BspA family leucine-rich repeat surface protein [Methanosphaera sp.]
MGFFNNLFKPKYENTDYKKREEAAKELTDEDILIKLALDDPHPNVREAAIANPCLRNEDVLISIAKSNSSYRERRLAVKKITDEKVLFYILQNDDSTDVCKSAAHNPNLKSEETLGYVAKKRFTYYTYREKLIEKINDEKILCDIAKYADSPTNPERHYTNPPPKDIIAECAFLKVKDKELILDIAMNSDYHLIRNKALDKIDREEDLIRALDSEYYDIRGKVIKIISDENLLTDVSLNDESSSVRIEATKKIRNPETLRTIATSDESYIVRQKAINNPNLKDVDTLIEIINNDNDRRVRDTAIEKINKIISLQNNQNDLKKIVKNANNDEIRITAMENIDDENFLKEILESTSGETIHNKVSKVLLKKYLDSSISFSYVKNIIKNEIDDKSITTEKEVDDRIKSFKELIDKYNLTVNSIDTSKYYNDDLISFETLNNSTDSIYDLGEYDVLIILNDGTNVTSWFEIISSEIPYEDIIFISEDLSKTDNLKKRYFDEYVSYNVEYYDYYREGENKRPCHAEVYSCGNRFKNVVAIVCQNLTSDIESIDYMFTCCESLTTISGLDTWNTSNLKSMRYTFAGCESLENIANLEDLDTSSLQDISNIFGRYNVPIHEKISYNTAYVLDGVRNYSKTSFACEKIRNVKEKLNKWDMSNIVEKSDAFSGCVDLED